MEQYQDITYEIRRSPRRTRLVLEVRLDGSVIVRASQRTSLTMIRRFVAEKAEWIRIKQADMEVRRAQEEKRKRETGEDRLPPITDEQVRKLADAAVTDLSARVRYWAPKVGVTYGRITIRNQKSRWGSCSSKGNLNFNCLLMLAPEGCRDYVVIHELCHRKHMDHSAEFWGEVERVMPDYKVFQRWLKDQGRVLIQRMVQKS